MVQEGRGHAAIDVWAIGEAALWSASLVCGAGGDRAPSRSGLPDVQEVARRLGRVASTISSRELRRNAATRSGGLEYRATTCAMARRARCSPPKAGEACAQRGVKNSMSRNGWLASLWLRAGLPVPGPVVSWKSRRHGPRKDRRWANALEPGADRPSPAGGLLRTTRPCASAMKPSIKRCSFKVEARCAAN